MRPAAKVALDGLAVAIVSFVAGLMLSSPVGRSIVAVVIGLLLLAGAVAWAVERVAVLFGWGREP